MSTRQRSVLLPAVLAAVLALGACGGGDSDDGSGVASVAGGGTSATTASPTASGDLEKELLAYTECLRGEGLDVPDPTVDADGNVVFGPRAGGGGAGGGGEGGGGDGSGGGIDREARAAAREVCGDLPAGLTNSFSEEDRSAFQDAAVEFARCMRAEGVDVPDPDLSEGAGGGGPFRDLDRDDPEVQAAIEVCQKVFADAGITRPRAGGN